MAETGLNNLVQLSNYLFGIAGAESVDYALKDNKLDGAEVDQIIAILGHDGRVDDSEYVYMEELIEVLSASFLFDEIELVYEDLKRLDAYYQDNHLSDYAVKEHPELVNLMKVLPVDLWQTVESVILTNGMNKMAFNEDNWSEFKVMIVMYNSAVAEWLKQIQEALPTSPYKAELTEIYNKELKLLQDNQTKVQ
jgi:hypothetical protein